MKVSLTVFLLLLVILNLGCQSRKLPILGEPQVVKAMINGKQVEKVHYPVIPAFSFKNQDGKTVTEKTLDGKVYVADFFFIKGPRSCWTMKKNMVKIYEAFRGRSDVNIVSHTIDPANDDVKALQKYSQKLGVTGNMWHFVTGDYEKISEIGRKHYLLNMEPDPTEPGVHICAFVLVDKQKHIRGFYDGTDQKEIGQLVSDIDLLIEE